MKKSVKKITAALLCAALLIGTMLPAQNMITNLLKTEAAAESADVDKDSFLNYNAVPEGFNNASDPYGYGVGKAFPYVTQSETFYYHCYNQFGYAYVYDKMEGTQFDFTQDGKVDATAALADVTKLSFTQAVSFDGEGTGRNSFVAIVGIDASQMATVFIYDAARKKKVGSLTLDKMNEMNDSTQFYEASNHLSIVAGDFNGDGRDSLVVYATIHSTDSGAYGLFQIEMTYNEKGEVNGASCSNKTRGNKQMLNQKYVNENAQNTVAYEYTSNERNKLCVSMAVGDINNDRIDDLVVLSYLGNFKNRKNLDFEVTLPYLAVSYGAANRTNITTCRDEAYYVHSGSAGKYETIASPGVAVTNVDGEGGDEVIVAGEALYVETGNGGKYSDEKRTETIRIAKYYFNGSKLNRSYLEDGEAENTLTKNTLASGDDVFGQIKVAGIYMNGRGNPATVFINGDLYDLSNDAERKKLYTYGEIDKNPNGRSVQFIYSLAVGNFDHNSQGFEQINFIVAEKESGADDYDLFWATVGKNGSNYYGSTDIRKNTSTVLSDNKGDNLNESLSALVVAVDRDNDGVIAKYRGVNYYYSDPDVIAVLQAGPYFGDISDFYSNNNETTYTLTESQTYEEAKSDNVAISVCAKLSIDTMFVSTSFSAGYTMDWTQEFSNSITYEISKSWTAQGEDTVVVYRTPVFVYSYDVQDVNGDWKDSELCMTVEKKPVFTTMTIDEYNDFCDSFSNQQTVKDYNARKKDDGRNDLVYNMVKINPDEVWLGNEGNPFKYAKASQTNDSFKTFGDLQQPGTSDSSTSVSYSITTEESKTTEIGHGLHFSVECAAGPKVVKAGIETSLDYLNSSSSTTSTGYGTSFECNIQNPVKSAMIDAGYSNEQIRAYSFSWRLASWDSGIPAANGKNVPVVGYVLSDVHGLAHPPQNLNAVPNDMDQDGTYDIINLSWESNTDGGYPETSKYNIYLVEDDGSRTLVKSDYSGTSFEYKISDNRKKHTFVVRGISDGIETVDAVCSCDTSVDSISIKSIDKVETVGLVDKYKITYTGTKAPAYFYVTNGKDGQTAYEAAVENGYKGTMEQWLGVIGADCQINGHTYTEFTLPATCGTDGFVIKVCSVCGSAECSKLNALSHSYVDTKVEATCHTKGYTMHKCSNCGDFYIDGETSCTAHSFSTKTVKNTCCTEGYTIKYCTVCGYTEFTDSTAALSHDYQVKETVAATCRSKGYTVKSCSRCGDEIITNLTGFADHDYETETVNPGCTDIGYVRYTCRTCHESHIQDIIPAKGHKYNKTVTPPTCSKMGYTTYTCEICGNNYVSDMTETVSHTFTDEVIESTCTEKGYTIHYCKDCGYQEIIDRTEIKAHSWELTETVEPTCTEKGYSIYTCSVCGVIRKADETECTDHTPGEWYCDDYASSHYIRRCEKCNCKLDEKTVTISIGTGENGKDIKQGESVSIGYGKSLALTSGNSEGGRMSYTSSDNDVAYINENGEVIASGAGTAIITVTDEESGITTTFTVKIEKPWWQRVHEALASISLIRIIFVLFNISY